MSSNFNYIFNKLKIAIKVGKVYKNALLKDYTTMKIGGKAKVLVCVGSVEEIIKVMDIIQLSKCKYYVIGNGSNVVFDTIFEGVVICISKCFSRIIKNNNYLTIDSGCSMSKLVCFALDNSLSGLEDAIGIPGTIGGAVTMNAGAYNYKTSQIVDSVLVYHNNKISVLDNADCHFGYRDSIFQNGEYIILSVEIKLLKGSAKSIKERMHEVMELRKQKTPLNYPSAGSCFKNVEGISVAQLIEQQNLKGYRVGDAMVSFVHSNFIVNMGNATLKDVEQVIMHIQKVIFDAYNIKLVPEIKLIKEHT